MILENLEPGAQYQYETWNLAAGGHAGNPLEMTDPSGLAQTSANQLCSNPDSCDPNLSGIFTAGSDGTATFSWSGRQGHIQFSACSLKRLPTPQGGAGTAITEYKGQYAGKACRYTATSTSAFFAHTYADNDGSDCTPFLPASLFSTAFVTPVPYQVRASHSSSSHSSSCCRFPTKCSHPAPGSRSTLLY
jgi:hypothetical protein